jgi:hypothetical protein
MALDAERELTQWTAGIDVLLPLQIATANVASGQVSGLCLATLIGAISARCGPMTLRSRRRLARTKQTFRLRNELG